MDQYVYGAGQFVQGSASGSADEQVTLIAPEAGTYDVYVNGYGTPGGSTSYHLSNFVVPSASAGNATVTTNPADGTVGVPLTLTAT